MLFDKAHGNPFDKTSIQVPSVVLLKRVLPGLAVALLAVGCAQESSVSSDIFAGSVLLTGAVEFDPVFSEFKPVSYPDTSKRVRESRFLEDYVLELRDASGMAIRSVPFKAITVIGDGISADGTRHSVISHVFRFVVSDPPVYESFAVMKDGVELGSVSRSRNAPSISVSGPSSGDVFSNDETVSVSWVGSDADGDELVYRVYYSTNGGSFYRIMFRMTEATSKSFSATRLRGSSRARIGVSVSDGTRSVFAETPIFSAAGPAP